MNRLGYWITHKAWPLFVAFLTFVIANASYIVDKFNDDVGDKSFDWRTLLLFVAAIVTMFNTWSKDQALKLAASNDPNVIHAVERNKAI